MRLSNKQTLLLIAAVCALPIVAAYYMFFFAPPRQGMNYGELIDTRPLPVHRLSGVDGKNFSLAELKGKWIMVQVDVSACDARCRQKLYYMRQVRTAQGKEMDRIERAWLITDGGVPSAELLREYAGTHVARLNDPRLAAVLAADADRGAHIYLIDPLGNVMLRYPEDPDPARMIRDFERLLKYSRIG